MATALGMDIFVPNDTVRSKPDWAALSSWVIDAKPEDGGIPLGIKGVAIPDMLVAAFALGRKKAESTEPEVSARLLLEDCSVRAIGGTKNVLAVRKNAWPDQDLKWSYVFSNGCMLMLTNDGILMYTKLGRSPKRADLTDIGFPEKVNDIVRPNPIITIEYGASAGNSVAYFMGTISAQGVTPQRALYRFKDGAVTKVAFGIDGAHTDPPFPTQYTVYDFDFETGYDGDVLFRAHGYSGIVEYVGVCGDIAKVTNWAVSNIRTGFRSFRPTVIGVNTMLSLRFGVDRTDPTGSATGLSNHLRCILTSIRRETSPTGATSFVATDIASANIHGDTYPTEPSVTVIGNGMAIVVMPRLWKIGQLDDTSYNAGFQFNNPYSYWAIEVPIDGFDISAKSQEIMVTDGVGVAPLFRGVEYNRKVVTIPLGGGKALIFFSRNPLFDQGLNYGMTPEVHYFDGTVAHLVVKDSIYPDVEGFCIADGVAMFSTGQTDTTEKTTWYSFSAGVLSRMCWDQFPSALVGAYAARVWANLGGGVGLTPRLYLDSNNTPHGSHLWIFRAPWRSATQGIFVGSDWQEVRVISPIKGGAILSTNNVDFANLPVAFHFIYFGIIDGGEVVEYIGRYDNDTGGYQAPPVVRVSEKGAVVQLNDGAFVISPGVTTVVLKPGEKRFNKKKLKPPVAPPDTWAGLIGPLGHQFMRFLPTDVTKVTAVRDLRQSVLASTGEL